MNDAEELSNWVGYKPWTDTKGVINFSKGCSRGGYNGVDWEQWGHHREGPPLQYITKLDKVKPRSPSPTIAQRHTASPANPTELVLYPDIECTSSHRRAPHVKFPLVGRKLNVPSEETKSVETRKRRSKADKRDVPANAYRPAPRFAKSTGRGNNRIHWMPHPGGGTVDDVATGAYMVSNRVESNPKKTPYKETRPRTVQRSPAEETNREQVMTRAFLKGGREDVRTPAFLAQTVLVNAPPLPTAALEYSVNRSCVEKKLKESKVFKSKQRDLLSSTGAPLLGKGTSSRDVEKLTKAWLKRNLKALVEEEREATRLGKTAVCSVSELLAPGSPPREHVVLMDVINIPAKSKNVATPSMHLVSSRSDDLQSIITHRKRDKIARQVREDECCPLYWNKTESGVE